MKRAFHLALPAACLAFVLCALRVSVASPAFQASESGFEDQIRAEIESHQLDPAISLARQAVEQYPRSSALHRLLGVALFKQGLDNDARAALREAIELDASVPQNYYDLALVELSENRYSQAVPQLQAYLRLDPQNPEAHLLLGRSYHNLNQTTPAIAEFKKALQLAPQLPLAHYHLGYAYQSQGDLKAALEEFEKEMRFNARFYDSYWLAGNIEREEGLLAAAAAHYREGLKLKPDGFEAHYGLGRVLLAEKQFEAAKVELRQALAARPDSVEAHYALAQDDQQAGDKSEAEREFALCAELRAKHATAEAGIAGERP